MASSAQEHTNVSLGLSEKRVTLVGEAHHHHSQVSELIGH